MPNPQQQIPMRKQQDDDLLSAALDKNLWINPSKPCYGTNAEAALRDLDKLPPPRKPLIGKGVAPELLVNAPSASTSQMNEHSGLRSSSRNLSDRETKLKAMIKHIIMNLMTSHGESFLEQLSQMCDSPTASSSSSSAKRNSRIDGPTARSSSSSAKRSSRINAPIVVREEANINTNSKDNDNIQAAPSLYIIRQILPVLLPGIESLLRHSVHVAESRRLGSGRRAVHPTDWLASYLMRHNPRHQSNSSMGNVGGYSGTEVAHQQQQQQEVNSLTNAVVAELLTANKAKERSQSWKNRNAARVAELWDKFCPDTKNELTIEDVSGAVSEISNLLGYEDGIVDAEELFGLMDHDASGGVSFSEFERALGNYLQEAERFGQQLLRGQRGKQMVRGWAYKAARKLFNSRLQARNIHAQALFDKHCTQPEGVTIGFVGLVKAIGEVTDTLYEQKDKQRPELSPGLAKVDRSVQMDFDEFARTVAKEVDHAARQAEELAQSRARAVAEKRAKEDAHEQEELMANADRVSKSIKEADALCQDATDKLAELEEQRDQASLLIEKCTTSGTDTASAPGIAKQWLEQLGVAARNAAAAMERSLSQAHDKSEDVNARRKDAHISFELLKSKIRSCSRMQGVVVRKAEKHLHAFSSSVKSLAECMAESEANVTTRAETATLHAKLFDGILKVSTTWKSMCSRTKAVKADIEKPGGAGELADEASALLDSLTGVLEGLFGSRESVLREFSSATGTKAALRRVNRLAEQLEYAESNLRVLEHRSAQARSALGGGGEMQQHTSSSPAEHTDTQGEAVPGVNKDNDQSEGDRRAASASTAAEAAAAAADKCGDDDVSVQGGAGGAAVVAKKTENPNKKKRRPTVIQKGAVTGAAKSGNVKDLTQLLTNGADPNERDKNGSTALVHLSWPGNVKGTRVLLAHGADPLAANLRMNTCMHFAFERGHEELIKLLLVNGGRDALQMKNSLGKTPEMLNAGLAHLVQWEPTETELNKYRAKKKKANKPNQDVV
jgi:hypothetical protein